MKKKILGFLILIFCLLLCPKGVTYAFAEQSNKELNINTIYPNNILDYQDLTGITNISVNNKFIAYTINTNSINILNKSTRNIISIDKYNNINDIKFINDSQLLVVDYSTLSNTGTINLITINTNDNTYSLATIDSINISNLELIDIFCNNNDILIGIIKNISNESTFELHNISIDTSITSEKIDEHTSNQFKNANILTITADKHYIINSENEIIMTRNYGQTNISTSNALGTIQKLDYYNYNEKEYLVAFTAENLCFFSTNNFTSSVDKIEGLNISDLEIFNETIYIAESNKNIINSFEIVNENTSDILKEKTVLISSSYNSIGRFNSVSDIYISGNNIFVSDSNNFRIQLIDNELESKEIIKLDVNVKPSCVILDSFNNLYFIKKHAFEETSSIEKYSIENQEYTLKQSYTEYNSTKLKNISDTTITNSDSIYILDSTANKLILLNNQTGLQEKYSFSFDIKDDSKLDYIRGLNLLVLLNDDILYLLNPTNIETNINPIINTLTVENVNDISCDISSIYALSNNKLMLISINDNIMQLSEKHLENNSFSNFSTITYDIINQKMIAFNSTKQCLESFTCNLFESMLNFENITNNSLSTHTNQPFAIEIINDSIIYDMPYSLGNSYTDINYCIGIESFEDYYRVLFKHDGVLRVGFTKKSNAQIINYNTNKKLKVITTNIQVPVYKYPTLLKHNTQSIIISYIPINTYINIAYNSFPVSIDSKQFYTYEVDGKIGYIFNADIVLDDTTNIVNLHTNNASINAIGQDSVQVFDEDKTTIILTLNNDDRIYVEDYNEDNEYTKIIYKDSDLNTITGYIKTEYIQMDKLDNNRILLICIIIISCVILVSLLVTYIVIKRKK